MNINFSGGKKVTATFNTFHITTDQPTTEGGDNTAPTPLQLFLASLGTCTGYNILTFCQQRNIPTNNITLQLTATRDQKTHLYTLINLEIHIPKDFPTHYTDALQKTATHCAVKKHLEHPPTITTSIKTTP